MKFHIFSIFLAIILCGSAFTASAQVDSVLGQVTSATNIDSFAGGISGDGRFIVFESQGDLGTFRDENNLPNNSDGNREIFLFDYAQRRIFQITNTKSLLTNTANAPTFDNVKVDIVNFRPVISNDGKWIAFSSNATCNYPGNGSTIPPIVSTTNPGNFEPNSTTGNACLTGSGSSQVNNLVNDGNTEIWLYRVPDVAPVANLSAGEEIAPINLAAGAFTQVTNSLPSRLPVAGSTSALPIIADDNHDSSIDDTGAAISFSSNRDLVTGGNASPNNNDEIFVYIQNNATPLKQLTTSPRGTIGNPIYNANSTITNLNAGGWRIAFLSNANAPVSGMATTNSDNNEEIFYADYDASGNLGTRKVQITNTTRTNPGDVVNILNYGRRMSRDGRYIAFDSYATLESGGANQVAFGTFIYDTERTTRPFEEILPRSNSDAGTAGGDIQRYPGFTDYDANRTPQTIVLETRMNIRASDGSIPSNADEGLNNSAARQAQLYSTSPAFIEQPSSPPRTARPYVRLTKLPVPGFFLASIQPIPSNSVRRMTFNLAQTEVGTGNPDLFSEVFYFLNPTVQVQSPSSFSFATGASRIPVSPSPVPTPTATPTPSPSPTPTGSPSPTPTPTPQTPPAVQGVSQGMLAILDYDSGINEPVIARTAVGSLQRRFTLPIELSGVTMTINGAAAGLKSVSRRQIVFVVPPGLAGSSAGTVYPVVINNNGTVFKGNITVVPARPDVFNKDVSPSPGGRAKVFNATNRVLLTEPFPIRTFRLRGSRLVPTVFRLYLTGVNNIASSAFFIKIGGTEFPVGNGGAILTGATLVEPGVYTVDFNIPDSLAGAGDQPITVRVVVDGISYESRLADTAPRLSIL